jgi:hypothetical protein
VSATTFLDPAKYSHGTRARYVTGCRCRLCRDAVCAYARERVRRVWEAVGQVEPNGPPGEKVIVKRNWGKRKEFRFKTCPGTGGAPCVKGGADLRGRYNRVCASCVERAAVWSGMVDAAPARRHMRKLARKGVGYKSVADAANVGHPIAFGIFHGRRKTCRADTLRRILRVDEGAIADHALVPGAETIETIRGLHVQGFTWEWLSRELGFTARCGAALLVRPRATGKVCASTAFRIEKLRRRISEQKLEPQRHLVDAGPTRRFVRKLVDEGFTLKALWRRLGFRVALDCEKVKRPHADAIARLYREVTAEVRDEGPDLLEPELDAGGRRRLLEAYADGVPVEDLAQRFDKSPANIRQIARRAGVRHGHGDEELGRAS